MESNTTGEPSLTPHTVWPHHSRGVLPEQFSTSSVKGATQGGSALRSMFSSLSVAAPKVAAPAAAEAVADSGVTITRATTAAFL